MVDFKTDATGGQKPSAAEYIRGGLLFFIVFAFICIFAVADLIVPAKTFSENENKALAQMPKLTFSSLVSGDFASDYEEYVCDQFLLRDSWITVKSVSEYLLMKTENNGVVYGADGYEFVKLLHTDTERLNANSAAIKALAQSGADVSVMIVPSSYSVLSDKVPAGLVLADEAGSIEKIYGYLAGSAECADIRSVLVEHCDEYIYYRTDHHWTTFGAWLAYNEFCTLKGLEPFDYYAHTPNSVEGFYGTSYSKCKAFNAKADTLEYFDFNARLIRGNEEYDGLYNLEQFEKRDKYSGLLYGNAAMVEIESEYSADKRNSILIIRDSYADSLAPFLTENYNRIVLVDPRYYRDDIAELANDGFDDVLVLIGFEDVNSQNYRMLSPSSTDLSSLGQCFED